MAITESSFKIDEKKISEALSNLSSELSSLDEKETDELRDAGYLPTGIANWHIAMIRAGLVKPNG